MTSLDRVRELGEAQDALLSEARTLERAREKMGVFATARPKRPSRMLRVGGVAVVAAAAAAVLLLVLRDPAVTFRVGTDGAYGVVGDWISVPAGRELPVRFSDGTRVVLEADAQARVADLDAKGGRIVLERGGARASVPHGKGRRWQLDVGPYRVRVTGTRFGVSWDPVAQRFALEMTQGAVVVAGPLLERGRTFATGERVRVSVREERLELTGPGAVQPIAAAVTVAPEPEPIPAEPVKVPVPSWSDFARAGRYRDAVREADRVGFDRLCQRAGAADLFALGNAERLAGDPARAKNALVALRGRFPGDARAAQAAYFLGRIASDQTRSYGEAARWYETSVREQPGGPVAREAAGRLVEARVRGGDTAGARDAAQRYLERFPDGPHAALAKRVVER